MSRPKRPILTRLVAGSAIAVASGYLLYQFVTHRIDQAQQQAAREKAARINLRVRFDQTQKDCAALATKLLPVIGSQLFPALGVEDLTAQLQKLRVNAGDLTPEQAKKKKSELWESLKIASFTRTISAIYLLNLLYCFSHVQLNIIGRHAFMSSVSTESHDLDTESERKFLTFSWYLLHKGLFECMARVRQSVEQVFAGIAVSDDLTCDELLAHIASIRSNVEEWSIDGSSLTFSFDTYLLPPIGQEIQVLMEANRPNGVTPDASLFSCLNETRDFLESPDFSPVFRKCLDTSFGIFETQIRTVFPSQNSTLSNSKISEIPEGGPSKVKLAVSLPTVSRFTNEVLEPSENGLLQILDTVPEVKAISALIYTEWSSVAGV